MTDRAEDGFGVGYLAALHWVLHEMQRCVIACPTLESAIKMTGDSIIERMKLPPTMAEELAQFRKADQTGS